MTSIADRFGGKYIGAKGEKGQRAKGSARGCPRSGWFGTSGGAVGRRGGGEVGGGRWRASVSHRIDVVLKLFEPDRAGSPGHGGLDGERAAVLDLAVEPGDPEKRTVDSGRWWRGRRVGVGASVGRGVRGGYGPRGLEFQHFGFALWLGAEGLRTRRLLQSPLGT